MVCPNTWTQWAKLLCCQQRVAWQYTQLRFGYLSQLFSVSWNITSDIGVTSKNITNSIKPNHWPYRINNSKLIASNMNIQRCIDTSMRPVSGWKFLAGSSVVMRHWILLPVGKMLCWLSPSSGSDLPSATRICVWTRSTLLSRTRSKPLQCLTSLSTQTCHIMPIERKVYTGWLKLKYPTRQNAISRQPCEIFIPKVFGLYGTDPATVLKLKKKLF